MMNPYIKEENIAYHKSNAVTKAAIEEARSGKNSNKVYSSVDELKKDLPLS